MSVAACLLIFSMVMVALGPKALGFLTRGGSAPRFGIVAWLTAIGSVLATGIAIPALVALEVLSHGSQHGSLLTSCMQLLCDLAAGRAGGAAQLGLLTAALALIVAVIGLGVKLLHTILRLRAHADTHAQAARLVGRPTDQPHVYIVDAEQRTAYCVAGNPPAIVVTSSAVAALDPRELAAVLAHERAHLDGHHATIVTVLRSLAMVLPRVALMTRAATDVTRLLEMCADDAAARRYGQRTLLAGLLALAGAAPAEALGAADVALLSRAERLARPPASGKRLGARVGLAGATTLIALAPMGTFALGASGLLCS
ncbi:M56 family metallopeptidase [Mycolicibacterium lutetiense]|uniref:Zn-dependent protease with chaperone function n=1 Tax=Mycolicibacterium lutetiense TaxID=1641992 RepID=A0ABS4ZSA8_9MYCO|nr:M56 family metallopeptidase [Mycolicibacterium lutetiense]MBP2452359.1 Zn-dependent protease with chaperone function [Mycolicibacterium lutetiense]